MKTLFLVLPGVLILEDVCPLSLFIFGQNLMASPKSLFQIGLLSLRDFYWGRKVLNIFFLLEFS